MAVQPPPGTTVGRRGTRRPTNCHTLSGVGAVADMKVDTVVAVISFVLVVSSAYQVLQAAIQTSSA